jgi:mRNA-degrading endonuclease YafQ of YafQ-DinJ toxin-antitoxin module
VIRAAWDQGFKRSYKKRVRNNSRLKKKFWEKMKIFLENPFFPQLRTHKLSGKLAGQWTFSVDDDCRWNHRRKMKPKPPFKREP